MLNTSIKGTRTRSYLRHPHVGGPEMFKSQKEQMTATLFVRIYYTWDGE